MSDADIRKHVRYMKHIFESRLVWRGEYLNFTNYDLSVYE